MIKKKVVSLIIIVLIILEIAMSSYLIYKDATSSNVCFIGSDCNQVQNSQYGQIFGIKLPYYGVLAFFILLIVYFINTKFFKILTSVGAIISLILIFIQFFILKKICINCMFVDIAMIIIFLASIIQKRAINTNKHE